MARVGMAAASADRAEPSLTAGETDAANDLRRIVAASIEAAIIRAAQLAVAGAHADAARIVDEAMAGADPGNAGWLLPIEPLLHVGAHAAVWVRAARSPPEPRRLTRIRTFQDIQKDILPGGGHDTG